MVERQPGRPNEEELIGAALRFDANRYMPQEVVCSIGYFSYVRYIYPGKLNDLEILRREQLAEGLTGTHKSIAEFAASLLTEYLKNREH